MLLCCLQAIKRYYVFLLLFLPDVHLCFQTHCIYRELDDRKYLVLDKKGLCQIWSVLTYAKIIQTHFLDLRSERDEYEE
jgi:hypothetical protein